MKKISTLFLIGLALYTASITTASAAELIIKEVPELHYGSCFVYQLRDKITAEKISLPSQTEKAFDCPVMIPLLSPDQKSILYYNAKKLYVLDLATYNIKKLFTMQAGIKGVNCVWSKSSTKAACVIINPKKYKTKTKIAAVVFKENGKLKKKVLEKSTHYTCASTCFVDKAEFWIEGDEWIHYKDVNLKGMEKMKTIKLP